MTDRIADGLIGGPKRIHYDQPTPGQRGSGGATHQRRRPHSARTRVLLVLAITFAAVALTLVVVAVLAQLIH